jgi:hypothetical protein
VLTSPPALSLLDPDLDAPPSAFTVYNTDADDDDDGIPVSQGAIGMRPVRPGQEILTLTAFSYSFIPNATLSRPFVLRC